MCPLLWLMVLLSTAIVHAEPAAVGSVQCTFPKAPQFLETPICPPTSLKRGDAVSLGWQLAPELRFHPLEESFLLDPARFFNSSALFSPRFILSDEDAEGCPSSNVTCAVQDGDWRQLANVWQANRTAAMFLHRSWLTTALNDALTEAQKQDIVRGDPFDEGNRSSSSVPFTVTTAQNGNAWIFTYHQYYAWNGCSNQALSTRFGSQYDVIQYFMCPIGVHEGDWEHVGLFVCPGDLQQQQAANPATAVRRVHYSQHGWLQEYDCSQQGQCPFEQDAQSASKLVAYVGLFSHALYPSASDLWVYSNKRLSFLYNMDGLFVGDRTAGNSTHGRRWVPSQSNVRYVPPAEEIQANSSDLWALYTGNWGALELPLQGQTTLTCFSNNFRSQGECPSSPSFDLLKSLTRSSSVESTAEALEDGVTGPVEPGNRTSAAAHRTGPLQRDYSYIWLAEKPAPVWKDYRPGQKEGLLSTSLKCPAADPIEHDGLLDDKFGSQSLIGVLWGILVATLLVAVVVGLLLMYPVLYWHSTKARGLVEEYMLPGLCTRQAERDAGLSALDSHAVSPSPRLPAAAPDAQKRAVEAWAVPLAAVLLFLLGLVLVSVGLQDLFGALDDVYSWSAWGEFQRLIIAVLAIGFLFDATLAFLAVCGVPGTCCGCSSCCLPQSSGPPKSKGNSQTNDFSNPAKLPASGQSASSGPIQPPAGDHATRIRGIRRSIAANALSTFVLVVQLAMTVVLFGFGLLILVGRSMLAVGCEAVTDLTKDALNSIDGVGDVCVDLSPVGLRQVSCGEDVVRFCNGWENLRLDLILWGSYAFLLSHLIMLLLTFQRGSSLYVLLNIERFSGSLSRLYGRTKLAPSARRSSVGDGTPVTPLASRPRTPVSYPRPVSSDMHMVPGLATEASGVSVGSGGRSFQTARL